MPMPKLKDTPQQKRDRLFRGLIDKNIECTGIDVDTLCRALKISRATYYRKRKNPNTFTRGEMARLFTALQYTQEEKGQAI